VEAIKLPPNLLWSGHFVTLKIAEKVKLKHTVNA